MSAEGVHCCRSHCCRHCLLHVMAMHCCRWHWCRYCMSYVMTMLSPALLPILYVACRVRKTRNVTVIVVPPVTGHLAKMSSRYCTFSRSGHFAWVISRPSHHACFFSRLWLLAMSHFATPILDRLVIDEHTWVVRLDSIPINTCKGCVPMHGITATQHDSLYSTVSPPNPW